MKTMSIMKTLLVTAVIMISNVTISARTTESNLVYNAEEVNGVKVAETVYKRNGDMLTNYMKYNYKYDNNQQMTENLSQKWNEDENAWENDLCIRFTYDNKSITTQYYKWNPKKHTFVLIPSMTVTMDK